MKKILKSYLVVFVILLTLLAGSVCASNTAMLAKDYSKKVIQVMTPIAIVTVAAGNVDVTDYRVIMSDTDVTIYFNSDVSNEFLLIKNVPLGIARRVKIINFSLGCSLLVM